MKNNVLLFHNVALNTISNNFYVKNIRGFFYKNWTEINVSEVMHSNRF